MTDLRRLGMAFAVACSLTCATSPVYASRKATDMMSEALKQRAAGNLGDKQPRICG